MTPQSIPLPADVAYAIDTLLEHTEIDAGTHTAVRLYAPRSDVTKIIDGDIEANGSRDRMFKRQGVAASLTDLADDIMAGLPVEDRGVIAHAAVAHMRGEVRSLAWCCATWAIEDELIGGCLKPRKRPMGRWGARYELSPKLARKLNGPNWIRRFVRTNDDTHRLRRMGERVVRRAAPIPRAAVEAGAELLAVRLQAQHEGYRRTNARMAAAFFDAERKQQRDRRWTRKQRATIKRAAATATELLGRETVSSFANGQPIVLAGETLSLEIARLGSSASLGHGTLAICAIDPVSHRRLADLCVYHERTPALDQLTALSLAMQAGEEAEIIKTANLSRVTELGLEHPLIAERGRDKTERAWRPRDDRAEKNEAYWKSTQAKWTEAVGVFVLGRMW